MTPYLKWKVPQSVFLLGMNGCELREDGVRSHSESLSHSEPFDDRLGLRVVGNCNLPDVTLVQRRSIFSLDLTQVTQERGWFGEKALYCRAE